MILISFVIPAFNSESYLHKAVESLLSASKDIEIIIINDGSIDRTKDIAEYYAKLYPNTVIALHKENGGHGSAINKGIEAAHGKYIKIIDSDDWVDESSLHQLLYQMKVNEERKFDIDLYLTNFVYEHVSDNTEYERDYSSNFPQGEVFTWHETKKRFKYSKTLLMHALVYKTQIFKDIHFELPEHTFYVDNLVAYIPLPYVKHLYYMKLPFYRYFIGRSDQSITLKNITNRYLQQIRVQKIMIDAYSYEQINSFPSGLRFYMKHCVSAIMMITQMFTVTQDSSERRNHLKDLWHHIKKQDIKLYRFLRFRSMNFWVHNLPWRIKSYVMVKGYLYLVKKVKLG
ncbi:MAG: glycosyltransferase family 2 protein [Acholeplasmataceae bacterium]|jgi:glycosyltransferase involved in cell wall biosynthesis|nr:glycosyltransferase family 2 protein [Acholeplasmataceae bacterium]